MFCFLLPSARTATGRHRGGGGVLADSFAAIPIFRCFPMSGAGFERTLLLCLDF
jgi:hypothetical protein